MEHGVGMRSPTDDFRETLHKAATDAARAADAAVTRNDAEPVVSATLATYIGDIEIPRLVLDYFVDEYLTIANNSHTRL